MIRQNFNADWTVEKGDGNSRMNSFLGNTQTQTVHLPYDAMIHEARTPDTKNGAQTGFYPGGEYIFQKHFTAPQAWQGKPVSLVFEGVYQTALVYLNGWLLTRNVNGYAEFTVEAGPYLKYGADNLLKVIADNSLEPNSRWYKEPTKPPGAAAGGQQGLPAAGYRAYHHAGGGRGLCSAGCNGTSAVCQHRYRTGDPAADHLPGGHGSAHRPAEPPAPARRKQNRLLPVLCG